VTRRRPSAVIIRSPRCCRPNSHIFRAENTRRWSIRLSYIIVMMILMMIFMMILMMILMMMTVIIRIKTEATCIMMMPRRGIMSIHIRRDGRQRDSTGRLFIVINNIIFVIRHMVEHVRRICGMIHRVVGRRHGLGQRREVTFEPFVKLVKLIGRTILIRSTRCRRTIGLGYQRMNLQSEVILILFIIGIIVAV
jgi:hypothetical protein